MTNDQAKENRLNQLNQEIENLKSSSPQTSYVQAGILEQLAELKRSNVILERAIHFYREIVLGGQAIDDELFKKSADKCTKLMKFRGWNQEAVKIMRALIDRFPDEDAYRQQLGVTYLQMGQNDLAKHVFNEQISLNDQDLFSKAHLGFILKSEGVQEGNTEVLQKAADLMAPSILDEEKSKDMQNLFYFHLGDAYRRLGQSEQADEIFKLGTERRVFPSFWQRSLYNEPNLKAQPIWPLQETGILRQLQNIKANFKVIKEEALALQRQKSGGFIKETEGLKDTGYWGQFDLFVQGRKKAYGCSIAPVTCSLMENIPEIKTNRRGQVKFSIMKPGTHVHAHSGPTNCRLRAHLGIKIPPRQNETSTAIRVADQYLHWEEGEIFVFDDSFDHEVWNLDGERIVLIFDLWHPGLSAEKRASLPAI